MDSRSFTAVLVNLVDALCVFWAVSEVYLALDNSLKRQ